MSKRKWNEYDGASYGAPKRYSAMTNDQLAQAYGNWKTKPKTFRRSYKNLYGTGRGPYRTGGFYGASVRSPTEKKVIDTALTVYDVNATGSVTLISGEWIAQHTGCCK